MLIKTFIILVGGPVCSINYLQYIHDWSAVDGDTQTYLTNSCTDDCFYDKYILLMSVTQKLASFSPDRLPKKKKL